MSLECHQCDEPAKWRCPECRQYYCFAHFNFEYGHCESCTKDIIDEIRCGLCNLTPVKKFCKECKEWYCAEHYDYSKDLCEICSEGHEEIYYPTLTRKDKHDASAFLLLRQRGRSDEQIAKIADTPIARVVALIEAELDGAYENVTCLT